MNEVGKVVVASMKLKVLGRSAEPRAGVMKSKGLGSNPRTLYDDPGLDSTKSLPSSRRMRSLILVSRVTLLRTLTPFNEAGS